MILSFSCLLLPGARITDLHLHTWFIQAVLGLEPSASSLSGKHSTNEATWPALEFTNTFG